MFLSKKFIYLLTLVALMCSCVSRKQLAYFQTITPESAEEINRSIVPPTEPRVKVGDALIITVTALDLEAVIPYNLPSISHNNPYSATEPTAHTYQYYTVDYQGDIEFPILGKLHVEGLSFSEIINMITHRLEGQIVDPIVTVRFLNAKVTVLGEVRSPGSYSLNNGKMTILEALGAAGDLTPYGRRDNVLIIRDQNGQLEFERINLNKEDVFTSPYFQLQQKDVVVIEPNQARSTSNQTISLWLSMVGTVSSAATVIVSVLSINK
jgi:polysaccharide export outer membrane protein